MPFTVMNYHMIWTTKYRQKTISAALESSIIAAIQDKSQQLNSPIHAINTLGLSLSSYHSNSTFKYASLNFSSQPIASSGTMVSRP
jgi:hypothetical protein